jgi:cytochrome c oxidase subunit IV
MSETIIPRRVYYFTFIALIILTGVTAAISRVDLGPWSSPVALLIAGTKAGLVALFFMHLRYEHSKMVRIWAFAGLFWLFLLIVLSMADFATRDILSVPGK